MGTAEPLELLRAERPQVSDDAEGARRPFLPGAPFQHALDGDFEGRRVECER